MKHVSTPVPDVVFAAGATLGEGATWDPLSKSLLWVDIDAGQVHRLASDGTDRVVVRLAGRVGVAAPQPCGGLLVACEDRILAVTESNGTVRQLASVPPACAFTGGQRFNDGALDPSGGFMVGSIPGPEPDSAALFRWDGHAVHVVLRNVGVSNGIGWSPDRHVVYFVDTPTARVDRFDWVADHGELRNRRVLIELPGPGRPDGLTVDDDGCVWVAMNGGGRVVRVTPDGRMDTSIRFPTGRVTSCALGGPTGTTLYVTSARKRLSHTELGTQPYAGAVFAVDVNVTGTRAAWCGLR